MNFLLVSLVIIAAYFIYKKKYALSLESYSRIKSLILFSTALIIIIDLRIHLSLRYYLGIPKPLTYAIYLSVLLSCLFWFYNLFSRYQLYSTIIILILWISSWIIDIISLTGHMGEKKADFFEDILVSTAIVLWSFLAIGSLIKIKNEINKNEL